MHVLHLTRDFPPRMNGGLTTAVSGLVRALAEESVSSSVISFDAWRPLKTPNAPPVIEKERRDEVEILRVERGEVNDQALAFAKTTQATVVHVHDPMLWPLARHLREYLKLPLILSVHVMHDVMDALRQLPQPTASATLQAVALAQADAICVPSRAVLEHLESLEFQPHRLHLTPLGVWDSKAALENSLRNRPKKNALYAARFADVKGTDEVMHIVDHVGWPADAKTILAGGLPAHPKGDRRWRRRIENHLAEKAPSSPRLEVKGWLGEKELHRALGQARLLVVPSRFETFGQNVAEAQLHGLPVVAYGVGALTERIAHQQTGLLVKEGDVDGFVASVTLLLQDQALAAHLGQAAAAMVRKSGLWSACVSAYVEVYGQVINHRVV